MKIGFGIWVFLLLAEIFWLLHFIVRPHLLEVSFVYLTLIVVTLVVGSVGLFVFNKKE